MGLLLGERVKGGGGRNNVGSVSSERVCVCEDTINHNSVCRPTEQMTTNYSSQDNDEEEKNDKIEKLFRKSTNKKGLSESHVCKSNEAGWKQRARR